MAAAALAVIDAVTSRPEFAGASFGVCAQQWGAAAEDTIISIDADRLFVPASNTKLFTICAAQQTFGSSHRLRTEFWLETDEGSRGPNHRLVLRGGSDPTLVFDDLVAAARALTLQTTAVVNIAVDVGRHAQSVEPSSWSFAYLEDTRPDGMPSVAIVDRNRIQLSVVPGVTPGTNATLEWQHSTDRDSIQVLNEVTTVSEDQPTEIAMHRTVDFRGVVQVVLTGQVTVGATSQLVELQALDPNLRVAHLLAEAVQAEGIETGQIDIVALPTSPPSASALLLHVVESPPLREILRDCMQPSDNFLAEVLLQLLAVEASADSSLATAGPVWDEAAPVTEGRQDGQASTPTAPIVADIAVALGVEPSAIRLVDGSGVSRQNLVTPRAVMQLLQAKRDDNEWHEFLTVRHLPLDRMSLFSDITTPPTSSMQ